MPHHPGGGRTCMSRSTIEGLRLLTPVPHSGALHRHMAAIHLADGNAFFADDMALHAGVSTVDPGPTPVQSDGDKRNLSRCTSLCNNLCYLVKSSSTGGYNHGAKF